MRPSPSSPSGAIFAYSFYAVLVAGQLSLGPGRLRLARRLHRVPPRPKPSEVGDVPALLIAIVIGMVVGAAAAVVLGLPTMHLRGVFLAIATLAFAEAVRILILNHGVDRRRPGHVRAQGPHPGHGVDHPGGRRLLVREDGPLPLRPRLEAIREDELAARAMGIDVGRHRLSAFVTAGAVAGLYGVLWAYYVRLIAPRTSASRQRSMVSSRPSSAARRCSSARSSAAGSRPSSRRSSGALGVEAGWIRPFVSSTLLLVVILFLPGGLAEPLPAASPDAQGRSTERPGSRTRSHPAPGELLASLAGLSKEYGGVHAVQSVDLELRSEVLGLIGPNGAGKTTLVNMISGLTRPRRGATVLGWEVGRAPVHRVARPA